MGLERQIRISDESLVAWPAIRSRLLDFGETPSLRMIDGELAFPDDEPSREWQELRVALRGGIVTVRRTRTGLSTIIWGNADDNLLQSWHTLSWVVAGSASGLIEVDTQWLTVDEFASHFKLQPA